MKAALVTDNKPDVTLTLTSREAALLRDLMLETKEKQIAEILELNINNSSDEVTIRETHNVVCEVFELLSYLDLD